MKTIFVLLTVLLAIPAYAHEGQHLPYDDFIRMVESGNIQSVTLDNYASLSGTMVDDGVTNQFWSYAKTGTANDPLLNQLLKEHHVDVSMRDVAQPNTTMPMLTGFIFLVAPILFTVLLIVIIVKLNRILKNQAAFNQRIDPESH